MLTYDQRVQYGGLTFRLRTEQVETRGVPHIVSSVLFRGRLVSSRRTNPNLHGEPLSGLHISRMMGHQHWRLLVDLTGGKLDERITSTPGTDEFQAVGSGSRSGAAPTQSTLSSEPTYEHTDPPVGVDDVIQEWLLEQPTSRPRMPRHLAEAASEPTADASSMAGPVSMRDAVYAVNEGWAITDEPAEPPMAEFDATRTTAVGAAQTQLENGAGMQAAFSGSLAALSLADLLDFLTMSSRSGTIVIMGKLGVGHVRMHAGRITSAVSPSSRRPKLHSPADTSNLHQPPDPDQVRAALLELVQWSSGTFSFEPASGTSRALSSTTEVGLPTRALLLDVLRELDERRG